MSKSSLMESPLKSSGEKGIFNKYDWIKEADKKLISAKLLREAAYCNKIELENKKQIEYLTSKEIFEIVNVIESANKSSILLLGYALELLLKSGIVSLLIHAPKNILEKKVRAYSHDLLEIAKDLHFELSNEECSLLETLSSYIIRETRYPVAPESLLDYNSKTNDIVFFVSNDENFTLGLSVFNRLKEFVKSLDGTSDDIKFHTRMEMENNGYVVFRTGGHLPPIFIVKFCQTQIELGTNNLCTVKKLLLEKNQVNKTIHSHLMEKSWDSAYFFVVSGKKGLMRCS
ncbi:hypothetical protein [Photobacterium leiognathi]|uniref:hypothetical protein n=1 Tax=Photobacterium leiognathi TaxID=553611 RepID=UPI0029821C5D|nr:hypothetical protein [Photobacterium leiognathi]